MHDGDFDGLEIVIFFSKSSWLQCVLQLLFKGNLNASLVYFTFVATVCFVQYYGTVL